MKNKNHEKYFSKIALSNSQYQNTKINVQYRQSVSHLRNLRRNHLKKTKIYATHSTVTE